MQLQRFRQTQASRNSDNFPFAVSYDHQFAIDFLATPEEHEKDDGVQLLSQRWDEEIAISRPTKMYILRTKRDSLIR